MHNIQDFRLCINYRMAASNPLHLSIRILGSISLMTLNSNVHFKILSNDLLHSYQDFISA